MSYYSAEEMKKTLKDYPKFQKRLYCRGFLITNEKQNVNLEYPFYANWKEETIGHSFYMYTHKETYAYTFEKNQVIHFIIGHGRNITLFDPIIEYIKQYHIKDVVNIVAILSGISAILVGVASIRISNLGAVKEYFQQGDNKEYTTARHNLYKKFDENVPIDPNDADASNTVSFFHFWGLMVKKKYLPFWVFKSASGHAVIRLYEGLREMIEIRRVDNPEYAEYFEWIYRKCCRALKHSEAAAFVPVEKKQNENSSFFSESELKAIGFLKYGKNVLVSRKASIYNPEQMILGDNIRIDDFCILSGNIKLGSYIHIRPTSGTLQSWNLSTGPIKRLPDCLI